MPTQKKDIFEDIVGADHKKDRPIESEEEIEKIKSRLRHVIEADIGKTFRKGQPLTPDQLGDTERDAIKRINYRQDGRGGSNIQIEFHDPSAAFRELDKIEGYTREEETVDNPLQTAFEAMDREDVLLIVKNLRDIIEASQAFGGDAE